MSELQVLAKQPRQAGRQAGRQVRKALWPWGPFCPTLPGPSFPFSTPCPDQPLPHPLLLSSLLIPHPPSIKEA